MVSSKPGLVDHWQPKGLCFPVSLVETLQKATSRPCFSRVGGLWQECPFDILHFNFCPAAERKQLSNEN